MAKTPKKRRGITLGARAESAEALDGLLNVQSPASVPPSSDQAPAAAKTAGAASNAMPEELRQQLTELQRMNTEMGTRWQRQVERLQELEQQRDHLSHEMGELKAQGKPRRSSGRLGVLFALLALVSVAALGFHTWLPLQQLVDDLNRVSKEVDRLPPQMRVVRGEVRSLTTEVGQMDSTVASLRKDVSAARSDLGALKKAADTATEKKGAVKAKVEEKRRRAQVPPRQATNWRNPYRTAYPMGPWYGQPRVYAAASRPPK